MRPLSSFVTLSWLASFCFVWAQTPPPAGEDPTFRTDTRLVVLPVSVLNKDGKLVTDLQQKAFKVFENGVEQPIKIFRREDVPISLGIIIDNSGSMREKRQRVDTAMRDAIDMSMTYLKKEGHRQKKVLLVITDGNDNASNISLEKLVNRAQQNEVLVYSIGLLNEEERREARLAKRALDSITRDSGGLAFYPKGPGEVDAIALQVAHEIRNQYTIAYSPTVPEMDGSFRQIRVTVNGPGHPQVRTRTGYYATPDTSKKTLSQLH